MWKSCLGNDPMKTSTLRTHHTAVRCSQLGGHLPFPRRLCSSGAVVADTLFNLRPSAYWSGPPAVVKAFGEPLTRDAVQLSDMSGAGGAGAGASVEAATTTPRTSKRRLRTAARRGSVSLSHMSLLGKAKILAQQAKRAVAAYHDEEGGSSWHWIKDHKEAYVAARLAAGVDARTDGKVDVLVGATGTPKTIKKDDLCWEIAHIESLNTPVSDMVKMDEVNEATILENLRARFKLDEIYTNIGTILVSINPFKWMDHLYTKEYVEDQLKLGAGEETTPHVFTIANASYQGLRNERLDQSIIISGESGAGKTEATKKCLQFFAEAAGRQSGGMEKRLLSANPILEAFGNAKTVRNNNSSRFGKWMVVHFDGRAQICGSQIVNYLLEKSRVVSQNRDERNYHIFYNLCTGGSQELKERLGLRDVGTYQYVALHRARASEYGVLIGF